MPSRPAAGDRPTTVSPFAWWALGLGIFSALPCMWIYFVPAISGVVAGVLALRHIRRWSGRYAGTGMVVGGLTLSVLSIALGLTAWILRASA